MYGYPFNQAYNVNYNPYQQYASQQPQQGLIKVTGLDGAKAYQMPPNSVAALFDANNDIFYVKSTDGAGFPTIRAFAFTPYNMEQPNNEYVTRAEFNQLKEAIFNAKQSISAEPTSTEQSNGGSQ